MSNKSKRNKFLFMNEGKLEAKYEGKVLSLDKARERRLDLKETHQIDTKLLDCLTFPGFEKLSWRACEVIKILVKGLKRKDRDPWESLVTNPPKLERVSEDVQLQRAWTFYRTLMLRLKDSLNSKKETSDRS